MMDAIYSGMAQFLTVLISFFPLADISVTQQLTDFTASFRQGLSLVGVFVPVNILLWALGLIMTVEIGILAFKTYRWIASNLSLGFLK